MNPAAAAHLAANLGNLTHPGDENTPPFVVPLAGYRVTGMPTELAQTMNENANMVGVAMIHTLEQGGFEVITRTELDATRAAAQPITETRHKQVAIHCNTCGTRLMTMNINTDKPVTSGPHLLESLARLDPACPHAPRAT